MADLPNFSYLIEGRIAGSAYPGYGEMLGQALARLQSLGIGAILSLTEEAPEQAMLREFGFQHLHLPIPDFTAPKLPQIDRAMEFLAEHTREGRQALVHCTAGMGRTGTLLACYLVHSGLDPAEAIDQVRVLRPGSVETHEQERVVHEYARHLKETAGRQSKSKEG